MNDAIERAILAGRRAIGKLPSNAESWAGKQERVYTSTAIAAYLRARADEGDVPAMAFRRVANQLAAGNGRG